MSFHKFQKEFNKKLKLTKNSRFKRNKTMINNVKQAQIEAFFEKAFREVLDIGIDENINPILTNLFNNLDGAPIDLGLFDKTLQLYRKNIAQKSMYQELLEEMIWQATIQDKKNW